MKDEHINSWLSSCGSGLSLGVPTKVKAHKSFLFTEYSLKVKNKEHLIDFVVTLKERKVLSARQFNIDI